MSKEEETSWCLLLRGSEWFVGHWCWQLEWLRCKLWVVLGLEDRSMNCGVTRGPNYVHPLPLGVRQLVPPTYHIFNNLRIKPKLIVKLKIIKSVGDIKITIVWVPVHRAILANCVRHLLAWTIWKISMQSAPSTIEWKNLWKINFSVIGSRVWKEKPGFK